MYLLSMAGMEAAFWVTGQSKTLGKTLLAPVLVAFHWLREAMTRKQDHEAVVADGRYVRRTHAFVMLVESDVKEGVGGLLP